MIESTREVFARLPEQAVALFYVLSFATIGVFLWGLWLRARKFRRGRTPYSLPLAGLPGRVLAAVLVIAKHTTIGRDDGYVRIAHFLTFWGFSALFVATAILTVEVDVVRHFWPSGFWRGPFYLGYEVGADFGGVALVAGVVMLMARRWWLRPFRLSYERVDLPREGYDRSDYGRGDLVFLALLLGLGLSGFLLEGARIVADRPDVAAFSFAGAATGAALEALGLSSEAAEAVRAWTWWAHAIAALAFVAYLPYGKGVHMLLDPLALVVRDERAGRRLPAPEAA